MGKAARWLRGLLGGKKPDSSSDNKPAKEKRRWSFVRSYREKQHSNTTTTTNTNYNRDLSYIETVDPNKHAIAVAAAAAAVAEAAVAAAQAAAAVVRLTSSGRANTAHPAYVRGVCGVREERAAVKIQALFRGYLSRRALLALKALVKLQALVRGHIVRKQTSDMLRRMQAMLRAQARARAGRAQISESPPSSSKSSQYHHPGPATPENFEHNIRARSMKHDQSAILKRNASKSSGRVLIDQDKPHSGWNWLERHIDLTKPSPADDEKNDKILEIDPGKPHFTSRRKNLFQSDQNSHSFTTSKDSTTHQTVPSPSSYEVQSLTPLKFRHEVEEASFCTADNSPQFFSASSRGASSKRGPFTPTKSDGSTSFLSGYSDHPNYMANTESSRAKVRSLSAPKQRPHFEKSNSAKRYSVHGFGHRVSALQANFTSKAYPGSGSFDRLGMPVQSDVIGSTNSGFSNN